MKQINVLVCFFFFLHINSQIISRHTFSLNFKQLCIFQVLFSQVILFDSHKLDEIRSTFVLLYSFTSMSWFEIVRYLILICVHFFNCFLSFFFSLFSQWGLRYHRPSCTNYRTPAVFPQVFVSSNCLTLFFFVFVSVCDSILASFRFQKQLNLTDSKHIVSLVLM